MLNKCIQMLNNQISESVTILSRPASRLLPGCRKKQSNQHQSTASDCQTRSQGRPGGTAGNLQTFWKRPLNKRDNLPSFRNLVAAHVATTSSDKVARILKWKVIAEIGELRSSTDATHWRFFQNGPPKKTMKNYYKNSILQETMSDRSQR